MNEKSTSWQLKGNEFVNEMNIYIYIYLYIKKPKGWVLKVALFYFIQNNKIQHNYLVSKKNTNGVKLVYELKFQIQSDEC